MILDPPYSRFIRSTAEMSRNQFISPKCITYLHEVIYKYGIQLLTKFRNVPPVVRKKKGLNDLHDSSFLFYSLVFSFQKFV